jgi:hypothetical protein
MAGAAKVPMRDSLAVANPSDTLPRCCASGCCSNTRHSQIHRERKRMVDAGLTEFELDPARAGQTRRWLKSVRAA